MRQAVIAFDNKIQKENAKIENGQSKIKLKTPKSK
jgi:hypothetical protein